MSKLRRQQGMTLLGFLIVLMVVAFFAFIVIRLFPVYSENYAVTRALKALTVEPGLATAGPPKIRQSLDRKLYISYAKNFAAKDAKIAAHFVICPNVVAALGHITKCAAICFTTSISW